MIGPDQSRIQTKVIGALVALLVIVSVGTGGYWFFGGGNYSLLDCLYMTVITISTVGFAEIIDLSGNPPGRVFTIFLALSGIGVLTYLLSTITASVVEGGLNEALWRKKMQKLIQSYRDHYIVCGVDGVGHYIIEELHATKRPCVVVDPDPTKLRAILQTYPQQAFLEGDATDNSVQKEAGIERARGLFAATGDDNLNLVICLTAKQLNPGVRVISRCRELRNIDKLEKAGADHVITTDSIGGLRMASVMLRPTVVSFLDVMLRDEKNLRIEEVSVGPARVGSSIGSLTLSEYPSLLLLAVKSQGHYHYHPGKDYLLHQADSLIVMTDPEDLSRLAADLGNST